MKQFLVTEIKTEHGDTSFTREELPPGGKWLTREDVDKLLEQALATLKEQV